MADAPFVNPFNRTDRPPLFMVTYELDFETFSKLGPMEQYQAELADAEIGVELLLKGKWKAAYTTYPDFGKGIILLKVKDQAEAEKLVTGYRMYQYFKNLKYTKVYSATQAGFNLKILWGGFKRFLGITPRQGGSAVPGALAVAGILALTAALAVFLIWWGFSKV